ncbi:hypothetical protein [Desulfovibrio sp. ZJ200]|uniref:hypothetical protein n=1 Tax=Desulfovibrio sp. ZJ200 TaxID=2709792 RepID=UPI0013ED02A4|nr:hypothetical protein [Desulfovibrio sp. ZJ200]
MTFATRMEPMDGLLPRILPQVLPCPRSMALDAVQMVAGDFCKETGVWSMVLAESVPAGECRITVPMPRDAVLVDVLGLYLDGRLLDRSDYVPSSYDIVLRFTPQSDAVATIEATARPARTASALPAEIMEAWGDVIAHGALARLKSMSGARIEWTDAQGAALHNDLYNEGCADARTRMFRNRHGGGTLYVNSGD